MDQERALVAPLPHPHQPSRRASFCATTASTTATRPPRRASFNDAISTTHKRRRRSHDLLPDYQVQEDALVVYDDERISFTLEPEGPKIEDVKTQPAVASCQDPPEELHRDMEKNAYANRSQ